MAKSNKDFVNFAKFICLAQTASDAGKCYYGKVASQKSNAIEQGYELKDDYINQALSYSSRLSSVKVGLSSDIGMTVVLFNIVGYGQVSFHSLSQFPKYREYEGAIEWNGFRGGSLMTCRKLCKKLRLPYY